MQFVIQQNTSGDTISITAYQSDPATGQPILTEPFDISAGSTFVLTGKTNGVLQWVAPATLSGTNVLQATTHLPADTVPGTHASFTIVGAWEVQGEITWSDSTVSKTGVVTVNVVSSNR